MLQRRAVAVLGLTFVGNGRAANAVAPNSAVSDAALSALTGPVPAGIAAPKVLAQTPDVLTLAMWSPPNNFSPINSDSWYGLYPIYMMFDTLVTVNTGVTFVPIPVGDAAVYAGLFSIDLPLTVKTGREFNVVVRRVNKRLRPAAPRAPRVGPQIGKARGGERHAQVQGDQDEHRADGEAVEAADEGGGGQRERRPHQGDGLGWCGHVSSA